MYFRIVDTHNSEPVGADTFATREEARPIRNELNTKADSPTRYIISRTEAHRHGSSNGISRQTPGKNWWR